MDMIPIPELGVPQRATVLALAAILMMGACQGPSQPGTAIDTAGTEGGGSRLQSEPAIDRVVLITIDTLRADHLPDFGYPLNTAPFLTSLARKSIRFQRAFAHSATTGPSHASMFTSLYPLQHRVQNNAHKLDDRFVTLAEVLSRE